MMIKSEGQELKKVTLNFRLAWLFLYSLAMGFMESAVVVYLRRLYYPDGFQFPLVPMEAVVAITELGREAATIIMLLAVGMLAFRKASERFAGFIFCFAVWDLVYYLFLKILLDWPVSWMTPDILFLIPVPWTGPVIAPCLVSCTMILLSLLLLVYSSKGISTRLLRKDWILLISGSLVVILSFLWDYINTTPGNSSVETGSMTEDLRYTYQAYIPGPFAWPVFLIGEGILLWGIAELGIRFKNKSALTYS